MFVVLLCTNSVLLHQLGPKLFHKFFGVQWEVGFLIFFLKRKYFRTYASNIALIFFFFFRIAVVFLTKSVFGDL